ncbi:MAG: hypothetical protein ABJF04_00650 [Reichenbachiella sp.]|uniref:hypothetical protein n=1 Tax=Reichenbachiella sp. TaxID=2184521 RepID=UPI003263CD0A
MSKSERTNIIILASIIVLSTVLTGRIIGWNNLFGGNIDFALHDTYFEVSKLKILILINSLFVYVVFLIKQLSSSFRESIGNYVLVISASILLLLMTFVEQLIWSLQLFMNAGWHTEIPEDWSLFGLDSVTEIILIIIKLFVIGTLFITAIRIGMKKQQISA